jgi:purine nucleoside phosphorylase
MTRCAIVGSAFADATDTPATVVSTPFGPAEVYEAPGGWLLPRHGRPHRWLPHQVPYRAHAWALRELGVSALLVTSSVGVLDPSLPLFTPLVLTDLVWPDNRLPDGTAASVWEVPHPDQGHLVVQGGLFDPTLSARLRAWLHREGCWAEEREVVFWYAPGPRTKTRAENRWLAQQGLHVNSMTVAPEVVLANELGIPTVGVGVGHKHSGPAAPAFAADDIASSLQRSKQATVRLVDAFLRDDQPAAFANHLHRFHDPR